MDTYSKSSKYSAPMWMHVVVLITSAVTIFFIVTGLTIWFKNINPSMYNALFKGTSGYRSSRSLAEQTVVYLIIFLPTPITYFTIKKIENFKNKDLE